SDVGLDLTPVIPTQCNLEPRVRRRGFLHGKHLSALRHAPHPHMESPAPHGYTPCGTGRTVNSLRNPEMSRVDNETLLCVCGLLLVRGLLVLAAIVAGCGVDTGDNPGQAGEHLAQLRGDRFLLARELLDLAPRRLGDSLGFGAGLAQHAVRLG